MPLLLYSCRISVVVPVRFTGLANPREMLPYVTQQHNSSVRGGVTLSRRDCQLSQRVLAGSHFFIPPFRRRGTSRIVSVCSAAYHACPLYWRSRAAAQDGRSLFPTVTGIAF